MEVRPCPLCNAALERSEVFSNRTADTLMHPDNGCAIGFVRLIVPTGGHRSQFESEIARLKAWNTRVADSVLREVRETFDVEYGDDGTVQSVSYGSEALRPLIAKLDAALQR